MSLIYGEDITGQWNRTALEAKRQKERELSGEAQTERLRDAHIEREANKRLAFITALIENNMLDAWQESGIQLATVHPVEHLGFPIP